MQRVLIIGGYGNFGRYIATVLAQEPALHIIIAGRSLEKAQALLATIESVNPLEAARLDIQEDLSAALVSLSPDIVIHTSGPFQSQSYDVAKCCIEQGCHYIDLADGRDFVAGITALHTAASDQGVLAISGASSVPCLTAALVDYYQDEYQILESLDYGISTAQKTTRGLATTAAILGYT
jgi:saccharopine dehydrogenase-like NADP-dependent oxidoreductase